MSVANCPHCMAPVPPEFASMPVCTMCGGDLKATGASPVWASVDIKKDNARTCGNCGESVKSILAMECPKCKASLAPAGETVQDIEKEKQAFENLVKSSNSAPAQQAPTPKAEPMKATAPVKEEPAPKAEPVRESSSMKEKAKEKEGFFGRLLRILGLKK